MCLSWCIADLLLLDARTYIVSTIYCLNLSDANVMLLENLALFAGSVETSSILSRSSNRKCSLEEVFLKFSKIHWKTLVAEPSVL